MLRKKSFLIVIGIVLVVSIIMIGRMHSNVVKIHLKDRVQHEFISIGQSKMRCISNWYAEQLKDVEILSYNNKLIKQLAKWQQSGNADDLSVLDRLIVSGILSKGFDAITIFGLDNSLIYTSEQDSIKFDDEVFLGLRQSENIEGVYSTDLFYSEQQKRIVIGFISTLYYFDDTPMAKMYIKIDPSNYLFPLIWEWPLENESVETFIVRCQANQMYLLSEIDSRSEWKRRFNDPVCSFEMVPINNTEGVDLFKGVDSRGVDVVVFSDLIAKTPWSFVAKIDDKEIYYPLYHDSIVQFLIFLLMILLIVFVVGLFFVFFQKNMFKRLWQNHEQYRATLYCIGDAVITTDRNGLILHFNPVAEKLTGWTEIDAVSKSIDVVLLVVSEDTDQRVTNPIRNVVEQGNVVEQTGNALINSKTGNRISISESVAPIYNDKSAVTGCVFVFRDQSKERKNEKELIKQKRQIFTLMSNLPGIAFRCRNDESWTMEFISKGCLKLTGYSAEEIYGGQKKSYSDLILPADRKMVRAEIVEALKNKINYQLEYQIITKNGAVIWVLESGHGIFNDQGRLLGIEGFISDINRRKHFESELKKSEQLFYTLANNASVGIFKTDATGLTTYVNPKWCELSGSSFAGAMDNSWLKRVHPDDVNLLKLNWEKDVANNDISNAEYRFVRGEDDIVWVKGQSVPEFNDRNELIGYIGTITDISDLNLLLSTLKEREDGFNIAQQMAKVGSCEFDVVHNVITWSKQMFRHFNLSISSSPLELDELLPLIHSEDRTMVRGALEQMSHGGTTAKFCFRSNCEVMELKSFAMSFKNLYNEKGEVLKATVTLVDITERKEFEAKLLESNSLLRTIIDQIPDLIYLKDLNGEKLIANQADLEYMGILDMNEISGKTDFDFYSSEIAEKFWNDDQMVMQDGVPIIDQVEKTKNINGVTKWLLTTKVPYRRPNGEIIGLVGLAHDITLRKKGDDERLMLSTVLAQSPVSIIVTNTNAEIEYVNPKFTEVTGYALEEVIGKNPRFLKSGTQSDEFYKDMWQKLRNGNEWRSELHNKKKNGQLFWENVIIAPIKNDNDELINYVSVKEDITEKKKMIEELVAATNKAVESERLKTSFLANMSHEIRTPLNSIIGFTSILNESNDLSEKDRVDFFSIVKKSSDSLLHIINDIIDISSLETKQMKIVSSEFEINNLLIELYKEFKQKVQELQLENLHLKKVLADSGLVVFADKNRLNQIFINLLSNAMKFTESGIIEFGVERVDQKYMHFFVSDTGLGIKKEMQSAIFDRFRQGEDSMSRHYGGNGLGLSIVKNLIELMNGEIHVESTLGKGTTFRFKLPRDIGFK